jgi:uncharacterized protein (TIGR02231 family)
MKRILIAAALLSAMSVSNGYAQETLQVSANAPNLSQNVKLDTAPVTNGPFAEMIVAKSVIKSVIVYNSLAQVTRSAEVDLPAGSHTVAFQDLPASLLQDSLRAAGMARATVKFGSISEKQIMVDHLTSPRERELSDKIQALEDQKEPFLREKAALDAEADFVTKMTQRAAQRNNENLAELNLKPDQWTSAARAIQEISNGISKSRAEQDLKLRDIDREQKTASLELAQISTGQRSIYTVLVPVESDKATKMTIDLTYQIPNATWAPIYDARVNTDGKSDLQIIQYATVRQQTGEDWSNVTLTLSTAQPSRGTSLAELSPMWINIFGGSEMPVPIAPAENQTLSLPQTPTAPGGDPLAEWRAKTEAKRVKMEEEQAPMEREAQFVPATISTGGFVSAYKIPGPATVPTDGSEIKLLIGKFDVESKLQVHIEPQLSAEAYLVAHSKLKGDSPLLPGQVSLFRDDAYIGQSALPLLRPGQECDLYFGIDDQVAVKRRTLKDERKQAGVLSKDNVQERSYVTQLQNLHNIPIDVIVKETTPSSANDAIKVDLDLGETTPGYVADADNIKGLLNWNFNMAPKEKKDLKVDWSVSWPTDYSVSGL